jgi:hypothetical protein
VFICHSKISKINKNLLINIVIEFHITAVNNSQPFNNFYVILFASYNIIEKRFYFPTVDFVYGDSKRLQCHDLSFRQGTKTLQACYLEVSGVAGALENAI